MLYYSRQSTFRFAFFVNFVVPKRIPLVSHLLSIAHS
jgi:hypothetical protein